ncbi:MAG: class I SAM-dependent methyltransferase [Candidatus Dormibacteraeota bacterium]|uniref:Class I SAM-dependent methyltransferase n=1 Tax=Candidatus Dormiibacter inghamiae TaxID=3127013 RepID=A0A934KGI4_9BACT|nr:class I SAM-dependent methyltransferase [Candidatus Dormibacteraeota bacterium]MBJ7605066.1 class I SAM-dependent methyltransferase [Candidatus Dormibacteraeota bacterium]
MAEEAKLSAHPATRVTRGHGLLEGFLARQRMRRADRLISPAHRRGRILDIGCGTYPLFLSLAKFGDRVGLDRVSAEVQAEWAAHGVRLLDHDVEQDARLPYANESYEVVTMLAVFEHLSDDTLLKVLREVHRLLKPGGQYIMTTPARRTFHLLNWMARVGLLSSDEIAEHHRTYGHQEIREILVQAGFPTDCIRLGYFELGLNNWAVATKPASLTPA